MIPILSQFPIEAFFADHSRKVLMKSEFGQFYYVKYTVKGMHSTMEFFCSDRVVDIGLGSDGDEEFADLLGRKLVEFIQNSESAGLRFHLSGSWVVSRALPF